MYKIIIIAILLFWGPVSWSQLTLRAGLNLTKLGFGEAYSSENNSLPGIQAGLGYNTKINNHFFVLPELNYGSRAGSFQQNGEKNRLRMHYLDLPVLIKYNPYSGPVFLQAGPQFSFLIGAQHSGDNLTVNSDRSLLVKSDFNAFDLSVVAGIGVYFGYNMLLEIRYQKGGRSLINEQQNYFDDRPGVRANTLSLLLGFYF